jgi:hypothetical protein
VAKGRPHQQVGDDDGDQAEPGRHREAGRLSDPRVVGERQDGSPEQAAGADHGRGGGHCCSASLDQRRGRHRVAGVGRPGDQRGEYAERLQRGRVAQRAGQQHHARHCQRRGRRPPTGGRVPAKPVEHAREQRARTERDHGADGDAVEPGAEEEGGLERHHAEPAQQHPAHLPRPAGEPAAVVPQPPHNADHQQRGTAHHLAHRAHAERIGLRGTQGLGRAGRAEQDGRGDHHQCGTQPARFGHGGKGSDEPAPPSTTIVPRATKGVRALPDVLRRRGRCSPLLGGCAPDGGPLAPV